MTTTHPESQADHDAVRAVHVAAFPTPAEAGLVDGLRGAGRAVVSLVARQDERVVGHVLLSPMSVESNPAGLTVLGLAPLAVLPELQRRGVGSALMHAATARCRELGVAAVVLIGDPAYYGRFGFETASRFGLVCEYDVPEEAFVVLELVNGALAQLGGLARYSPEFAEL